MVMSATMSDPVQDILSRLQGVKPAGEKQWIARCPAHDDAHASLSVGVGAAGRVLLHCHTGQCGPIQIVQALGLTLGSLFPPREGQPSGADRIVSEYDYRSAEGTLLFQVVRFNPKGFRQRRPDGAGGWIWNLQGVTRVLYRLPELLAAPAEDLVWIVEGEKDADALVALDLVATCNLGGAGKWRDEYAEALTGRRVCVIPDRDDAGQAHAQDVARRLHGKAAEVKVLELPGPSKDAANWIEAGGTTEALCALVDAAPSWTATAAAPMPVLQETQYSLAERVAFLHSADLRYDHRIGRWLSWTGQTWQPGNPTGEVTRLIVDAVRDGYTELADLEVEAAKRRFKFLRKSENAAEVAAVLRLLQTVKPVADDGEGWDSKPDLLGVRNGVIDLRTGRLRDGEPGDRITLALDLDFDPDAKAPRWERFITEVFPDADLAAFMRRALGYSLTGHTKEQCFFLCYGKGANGKSVLLNVMANLFGPLLSNVPFSTFLAPHAGTVAPTNDLAGLLAKRVVSAAETSDKSHLNEARLKAMTGGDPTTARFLYHEYFTYTPTCKIWLAVNHRPRVADDSLGFWRRVRLIPFERTFEGIAADTNLTATLAAELSGILAWAVAGAIEWYAGGGLQPPTAVLDPTAAYQQAQDPLDEFLTSTCDLGPDYREQSAVLADTYAAWANNLHYGPRDRLGRHRLDELLSGRFKVVKPGGRKVYLGLRLRQSREPGEGE